MTVGELVRELVHLPQDWNISKFNHWQEMFWITPPKGGGVLVKPCAVYLGEQLKPSQKKRTRKTVNGLELWELMRLRAEGEKE